MDTVVPTRYRVSTVTATGHLNLGASLDLDSFYEGISISDDVVYARHKDDEKGVQRARDKPRRRMKGDDENKNNNDNKKKNFENQVTIVVKDAQRRVNVKVFSNGQVQLTGLLDVDHGPAIIERVAGIFPVDHRDDASIGLLEQYKIQMINTDFKLNFKVDRSKLYDVVRDEYSLSSSFEPCIYPGVVIKLFCRAGAGNGGSNKTDGACHCAAPCVGKGSCEAAACKLVTVIVFESGSIIITGGQHMQHVEQAYAFICGVFRKHDVRLRVTTALPARV